MGKKIALIGILNILLLSNIHSQQLPKYKFSFPSYEKFKGKIKKTKVNDIVLYDYNCCLLQFDVYDKQDSIYRFLLDSGLVYRQMFAKDNQMTCSCDEQDSTLLKAKDEQKIFIIAIKLLKSNNSMQAFDISIEQNYSHLNPTHFYLELKAIPGKFYKVKHFGYFYSEL